MAIKTVDRASNSWLARPKVNLFLHVTARRDDGYHMLESLVSFVDSGDRLDVSAGEFLSLSVDGPFAGALEQGQGNLVLSAALALQDWAREAGHAVAGAELVLEKNLPIASGIGGGSADAAAALNALVSLWGLEISKDELLGIALELGADVPVCVESRSRIMRGIGEVLMDAPRMPPSWMVLANPMREVSTAQVFSALDLTEPSSAIEMPDGLASAAELGAWLGAKTRNDLEAPARAIEPAIDTVLSALDQCDGAHIARMSGSGATCFALFGSEAEANAAKDALQSEYPEWWVEAAALV